MEPLLIEQLVLSFLLGLLVGIQREKMKVRLGGMRTFPMISMFGTICALLTREYGNWVLVGGMVSLALCCVIPHLTQLVFHVMHAVNAEPVSDTVNESAPHVDVKDRDFGITTVMAAMLLFAVGALLTVPDMLPAAVIVGGGIAILLQFKFELHSVLDRLHQSDMRAIMQFVLISCVIWPVLPDQSFGWYEAFNPFEAWLMVVLIVGMSLGGYIVYKFLGQNAGILLGGILGGAISSTATTISYSKQSQLIPSTRTISAVVILVASTVVFVRILFEIIVICPPFFFVCVGPIGVMMLMTMIPAVVLWSRIRKNPPPAPEHKNPTQLKAAITFGLIYSAVKFALAVAKAKAGTMGMFFVAALSGLTDMDAITLSTSRMVQNEFLEKGIPPYAWRMILIAILSNLFFKSLIVGMIGDRTLFKIVVRLFAIPFLGGLAILFFWP